jgi:uncharacterized membrane protein YdfJ with MMPL/SSD domain
MRAEADEIPEKYGIEAYVTGTTALNIDTADQLAASLPRYIAVVVGLALLLLTVVFRSDWVPIKAAAGFLLSIAAAMGAVVWVFQDGNLAVSRMREAYVRSGDARESVITGYGHSGRVVTAAR